MRQRRPFSAIRQKTRWGNYLLKDRSQLVTAWIGGGAKELGLVGGVKNKALTRLLKGLHPLSPKIRLRPYVSKDCGWEACLASPKSLSINFGARSKISPIVFQAAMAAFDFFCRAASTDPSFGIPAKLVGALVLHTDNRGNEPHLHLHLIIFNVEYLSEERKWRAPKLTRAFREVRNFLQVFHSELAFRAHQQGLPLRRGHENSTWASRELLDFNSAEIARYSTRAAEAEAWRAAHPGIKNRSAATYATRRPKTSTPLPLPSEATTILDNRVSSADAQVATKEAVAAIAQDLDRCGPWLIPTAELLHRVLRATLGTASVTHALTLFSQTNGNRGAELREPISGWWTSTRRAAELKEFCAVRCRSKSFAPGALEKDTSLIERAFDAAWRLRSGVTIMCAQSPKIPSRRYSRLGEEFRARLDRPGTVWLRSTAFSRSEEKREGGAQRRDLQRGTVGVLENETAIKSADRVVIEIDTAGSLRSALRHVDLTPLHVPVFVLLCGSPQAHTVAEHLHRQGVCPVLTPKLVTVFADEPANLSVPSAGPYRHRGIPTVRGIDDLALDATLQGELWSEMGHPCELLVAQPQEAESITESIRSRLFAKRGVSLESSCKVTFHAPRDTMPEGSVWGLARKQVPGVRCGQAVPLTGLNADGFCAQTEAGPRSLNPQHLRHFLLFEEVRLRLAVGDLVTPTCAFRLPTGARLSVGCKYRVTEISDTNLVLDGRLHLNRPFLPLRLAYVTTLPLTEALKAVRPRDRIFAYLSADELAARGGPDLIKALSRLTLKELTLNTLQGDVDQVTQLAFGSDVEPVAQHGIKRKRDLHRLVSSPEHIVTPTQDPAPVGFEEHL